VATGRERGGIRRRGWRRRADDDSDPGLDPGQRAGTQPDDAAVDGAATGDDGAPGDPAEASSQASLDQVLRHAAEARAVPPHGDG
jgi:hypothetical protein